MSERVVTSLDGVCPLEPQIDVIALGNVRRGWLWYAEALVQRSFVWAYQNHAPVH